MRKATTGNRLRRRSWDSALTYPAVHWHSSDLTNAVMAAHALRGSAPMVSAAVKKSRGGANPSKANLKMGTMWQDHVRPATWAA